MIVAKIALNFLSILATVLMYAIFIRAIISWLPIDRKNPLIVILDQITEPVLAPLRKVVPMIGMMDITPLIAIILLQVISGVLGNLAYGY